MVWFIIIGIFILIVLVSRKPNPETTGTALPTQQNIEVPNPEMDNPKKLIHFMFTRNPDEIRQVFDQLQQKNIAIPPFLQSIFKEKITRGFTRIEELFWNTSIETFQIDEEQLTNYKDYYWFELKGVHETAYKSPLVDCILFEKVSLKKDPENKYDKNAIMVMSQAGIIGYFPASETDLIHNILSKDHKAFIERILDLDGYIDVTIKIYYNDITKTLLPK